MRDKLRLNLSALLAEGLGEDLTLERFIDLAVETSHGDVAWTEAVLPLFLSLRFSP